MTWQNKGGDIKDYLRETIKEMKARITELETENRRYKEVIIPNLQPNRTKEQWAAAHATSTVGVTYESQQDIAELWEKVVAARNSECADLNLECSTLRKEIGTQKADLRDAILVLITERDALRAQVEAAKAVLIEVDGLIAYQYSGSSAAMTTLQNACDRAYELHKQLGETK